MDFFSPSFGRVVVNSVVVTAVLVPHTLISSQIQFPHIPSLGQFRFSYSLVPGSDLLRLLASLARRRATLTPQSCGAASASADRFASLARIWLCRYQVPEDISDRSSPFL